MRGDGVMRDSTSTSVVGGDTVVCMHGFVRAR